MFNHIKKKEIQGKSVQIRLLPARRGLALASRLSKLLVPALGGSFDTIGSGSQDFTKLAYIITEQLDELGLEDFLVEMLDGMSVDGNEVNFDQYFMANYGELIEIAEFALTENFGSFFEAKGLKARFLTMKDQMKMKMDSSSPEQSE